MRAAAALLLLVGCQAPRPLSLEDLGGRTLVTVAVDGAITDGAGRFLGHARGGKVKLDVPGISNGTYSLDDGDEVEKARDRELSECSKRQDQCRRDLAERERVRTRLRPKFVDTDVWVDADGQLGLFDKRCLRVRGFDGSTVQRRRLIAAVMASLMAPSTRPAWDGCRR